MVTPNVILFDDNNRTQLYPFTFTRPVADFRIGILTIREKWKKTMSVNSSTCTEDYLRSKFPCKSAEENTLINSAVLPNESLVSEIRSLKMNEALISGEMLLAAKLNKDSTDNFSVESTLKKCNTLSCESGFQQITALPDIFSKNGSAIIEDYNILTKGRESQPLDDSNIVIGKGEIFIENDAQVNGATFNTNNGPVYIGSESEIMEGSLIRGPFALCDHAVLKMGAKIYGPTTIGPFSKVGGEVTNSVIFGYSNKAHDGFLGNSVIGEWCNLGADTNNSNLKNNYADVRIWNYVSQSFESTGKQFCGLFMGDHSKCGINTMFNTGTVVGVSSNIFGSGFPRNFIASFLWGGASGFTTYNIERAIEVAGKVVQRRGISFTATDKAIMEHIFKLTETYRIEL